MTVKQVDATFSDSQLILQTHFSKFWLVNGILSPIHHVIDHLMQKESVGQIVPREGTRHARLSTMEHIHHAVRPHMVNIHYGSYSLCKDLKFAHLSDIKR